MWIKRSLVIVPIVLFVFLIQSVFWVPGSASVSNNDSRQNRIILYMGGNPEDMNPWTSTKTSDSTISDYFFEGVVHYNRMYELEPWLADSIVVAHELTTAVPGNSSAEEWERQIRARYGKLVDKVEPAAALEPKLEAEDLKKQAEEAGLLSDLQKFIGDHPKMETLKVTFTTSPEKGKIVSAVQPDFRKDMEKHLGHRLYPVIDAAAEASFNALPEDKRGGSTLEDVREQFYELLGAAGATVAAHNPVVDCELRKSVYWTDGPFFDSPDKVFVVTVNGEEAGTVTADSAGEAEQIIRDRLDAEEGATIVASKYDQRFGDEADGPWWGRGPEFRGRDVKLTFDQLKDPDYGSPRRSSFTSIVETRLFENDPHRIQVVYDELYSPAIGDLTGSIMPYHRWNLTAWMEEACRRGLGPKDLGIPKDKYNPMRALRSRDRNFALAPSYLGAMLLEPLNGNSLPYWKNNRQVRLRRNEFYWNRKPEYEFCDWFVFDPALGSETSEVVFLGGGMDAYSAKDYQVPRYEAMEDKYYVIKRQPVQYEYFGFNMQREQLKDVRVRIALSMAINVEEIIKYVCFEQGQRINGPAYPVLPWYNNDYEIEYTWRKESKKGQTEKLKYLPFDMEEAKALLAEAGYREQNGKLFKDGKPLHLHFINSNNQTSPRHNSAMLAKERWEQLGVEVDFKEYEWNDFIQRFIMARNFDVCVLGWANGLDFDSRQLWKSDSTPPNGLNFCSYNNPKADELMEKILKVYDPEEQVKMSHQIFDTIASDFPYVFLYSGYTTTVVDKHIVWRKQTGVDAQGNPVYEDRPLTDEYIKNARASWRYFEPELIRREEIPDFSGSGK